MVVNAEDLEGVRDEDHVGAVLASLRDMDQIEIPACKRWGEL